MPDDHFQKVIGAIIQNCGVLELLTDNSIAAFARDPILVPEIRTLTFSRRLKILRTLLLRESRFDSKRVNSLCDKLIEVAKERNDIAHSPVFSDDDKGTNTRIFVRKSKKEITLQMLDAIHEHTKEAMGEFVLLVPESRLIKN